MTKLKKEMVMTVEEIGRAIDTTTETIETADMTATEIITKKEGIGE